MTPANEQRGEAARKAPRFALVSLGWEIGFGCAAGGSAFFGLCFIAAKVVRAVLA